MKRNNKRNFLKNFNFSKTKSKSKSSSKIPSPKSSKKNFIFNKSRFSQNKIKKIQIIQRNWRNYYKRKIEKKIKKIQAFIRGNIIRELFNEVFILNKKLECFFFIIKITMFRHAINYDYLANKRIDYYSDHKNTKYFLLLQRRIRYFLFMKKIKFFQKIGIFNNIYIITQEYRTRIKSKITLDKYLSGPIRKYHRPLSKIIMIQRNYKLHAKMMRKLNKNKINKFSLNKCPLITKEEKYLEPIIEQDYQKVKNRPINIKKDFYTKINYNYSPLLLIQKKYKERYDYLNENYKLKKHSKLLKKVNNKHHYIYHAYVVDGLKEVLLIQKNIKYLLYRRHSMVNLVKKRNIIKCEINKKFEIRESVKKYFYEEFAKRLVYIIKKFFINYNLKIFRKNSINRKISSLGFNEGKYIDNSINSSDPPIKKRRNSLSSQSSTKSNKARKSNSRQNTQKKEILSSSANKILSFSKQSNLKDSKDDKAYRERNSKKKVTFKSDIKKAMKDSRILGFREENDESPKKQKNSSKIELKLNKFLHNSNHSNPYYSPKKRK